MSEENNIVTLGRMAPIVQRLFSDYRLTESEPKVVVYRDLIDKLAHDYPTRYLDILSWAQKAIRKPAYIAHENTCVFIIGERYDSMNDSFEKIYIRSHACYTSDFIAVDEIAVSYSSIPPKGFDRRGWVDVLTHSLLKQELKGL